MDINNFEFKFKTSIDQVGKFEWNSVIKCGFDDYSSSGYPFLQYEFLHALEVSGCVEESKGWQPYHLTVYHLNELVAVMPLYLKKHSYGEYVFDHQWADAFHRAGFNYYPKLLSAIPFTPCSGPRLVIKAKYYEALLRPIFDKLIEQATEINVSSCHLLFPSSPLVEHLNQKRQAKQSNMMQRLGLQYHWFNENYQTFDAFLARCTMKRRKSIKRERRLVTDSGIQLKIVEGQDIDQKLWDRFHDFYQRTYAKKSGGSGYLNDEFFKKIGQEMPQNLMMVVAEMTSINDTLEGESALNIESGLKEPVAIALFFKNNESLYGRYWGASAEYQFLHFETCYYQGIQYCIDNGLKHFDAGAQGEHKIPRGFKPIETYSYHWIREPAFRSAVANFLREESRHVKQVIEVLREKLPFKKT